MKMPVSRDLLHAGLMLYAAIYSGMHRYHRNQSGCLAVLIAASLRSDRRRFQAAGPFNCMLPSLRIYVSFFETNSESLHIPLLHRGKKRSYGTSFTPGTDRREDSVEGRTSQVQAG